MKSAYADVDRIREAISRDDLDLARSLAESRETRSLRDHDHHLAWATVLEDLDMQSDVILELNLAVRDDPDRLEVYPRLAEVLLDNGQPHRAAKVWAELVKRRPEKPEHYEELGQCLMEARDLEKATEVYQEALKKTGDERFKLFLREIDSGGESPESSDEGGENGALVPQTHHLVTFTTLFAGREGVHARQWISPTGESGYTPVEEPLTPKVAENHLLGNYTVGAYPVRVDNTVNYVAFDLDGAKFAVRRSISRESDWRRLIAKIHSVACKLIDVASAYEIPLYIEDSGFKGRHCWIFFEIPIPAGVAKKFATLLAGQLPELPAEVTMEIFPKQTSVRRGGLGNLIKLPIGIHKRTGRRSLFLEADGTPTPDQLSLLERFSKLDRTSVHRFIQRMHARSVPVTGREPEVLEPSQQHSENEAAMTGIVDQFDLDRDSQFQHLMLKCSALKAVVEKLNRTGALEREETVVITHTLGHLENGPQIVNELLRRSVHTDPSLFLKSQLRGNPMSCPKVRARIPGITSQVACNCSFDPSQGLYPTPVIHVRDVRATGQSSALGLTVDSLQFQNLLQEYLKLRKQFNEVQILLRQYEEKLSDFFKETGVNSVRTTLGTLRLKSDSDGGTLFTLDL